MLGMENEGRDEEVRCLMWNKFGLSFSACEVIDDPCLSSIAILSLRG